ncbi:hypothetical protein I3843_12G023000 [Carya illinoinensis]|nr:hypothetical protein I3843_12G023000 [Carya illinoinensis]
MRIGSHFFPTSLLFPFPFFLFFCFLSFSFFLHTFSLLSFSPKPPVRLSLSLLFLTAGSFTFSQTVAAARRGRHSHRCSNPLLPAHHPTKYLPIQPAVSHLVPFLSTRFLLRSAAVAPPPATTSSPLHHRLLAVLTHPFPASNSHRNSSHKLAFHFGKSGHQPPFSPPPTANLHFH